MEALDAHPQIDAGLEELGSRREEGAEAQIEFARTFLTAPRTPPVAAAGFKTKLQDVLDRDSLAALLRDIRAHVILLQRRNVVKAVVSWFRSEVVNRTTGDWNVYRSADRPASVTIDPAEFAQRLRTYEEARADLQRYALSLERPTLMLYYEDLLDDPASTLGCACGFLGVAAVPVEGRAVKATPDDLRLAVTNLVELEETAGPRYRALFAPDAR